MSLQYDNGLLSFSLSENILQYLIQIISPLIKSKKLLDIKNHILLINELDEINNYISDKKI